MKKMRLRSRTSAPGARRTPSDCPHRRPGGGPNRLRPMVPVAGRDLTAHRPSLRHGARAGPSRIGLWRVSRPSHSGQPQVSYVAGDLRSGVSSGSETRAEREGDHFHLAATPSPGTGMLRSRCTRPTTRPWRAFSRRVNWSGPWSRRKDVDKAAPWLEKRTGHSTSGREEN